MHNLCICCPFAVICQCHGLCAPFYQVPAFTDTVKRAQERGSDTVLRMACGLQDLMRDGEREEKEALGRIQGFLDDFYQVKSLTDGGPKSQGDELP